MSRVVTIWAAVALAVVIALGVTAGRVGRNRSAAWLVVVGLFLLLLEEPAVTFWLGLSDPKSDVDAMAGLVTPMARAHVLDAGVYGVAGAGLLGWIGMTAFKRGEQWAWRVLTWGLAVVAVTEAVSMGFVFARGLPIPGAAGRSGFGWQPVAVGMLAWTVGLWLARTERSARRGTPGTVTAAGTP